MCYRNGVIANSPSFPSQFLKEKIELLELNKKIGTSHVHGYVMLRNLFLIPEVSAKLILGLSKLDILVLSVSFIVL